MVTPLQAEDYINTILNDCFNDSSIEDIVGYVPIVYWEGAGYTDTTTNQFHLTVKHDYLTSNPLYIGKRITKDRQAVIIEVKANITMVDGLYKVKQIIEKLQNIISNKWIDGEGVLFLQSRVRNNGVEGTFFNHTLTVIYEFTRQLE